MHHILNIKAISLGLKTKPKLHRLYHAFMGVPEQLTEKELKELKTFLSAEHRKTISRLKKAKPLGKAETKPAAKRSVAPAVK